jgi:16S rRNA (cytosine1402-N4)-methyltransferase
MNPHRGQSAAALLASISEEKLTALLVENADEPHAAAFAQAIAAQRRHAPLRTTTALANVLRSALTKLGTRASADAETSIRRVFQALRIAINDEFGALDTFLRHLPLCLSPVARGNPHLHSGEDRRVKHAFKSGLAEGSYSSIATEVLRPSPPSSTQIPAPRVPSSAGGADKPPHVVGAWEERWLNGNSCCMC